MKALFKNFGINLKLSAVNVILLANAFIWYFLAFGILEQLTTALELPGYEVIIVIGVNIAGIAFAGIIGSLLVDKLKTRSRFLYNWTLAGVFLSLIPLVFNVTNYLELLGVSVAFGLYFGIGMPATMGYFAASTSTENRSRLGGITFLIIGLSFAVLGNLGTGNITLASSILTGVRITGVILLSFFGISTISEKSQEQRQVQRQVSYKSVVSSRPFMLYFVPWFMFNIVSYVAVPFLSRLYIEGSYFQLATVVENVLIAAFAVISGFLSDLFGRKRLTIIGFAMLGIGYAILGLTQTNIIGWYFYVIVDGITWGIFYTVLLFTIWGDLAQTYNSEKYYVIGALPYLFSNFIRLLVGPYVFNIPAGEIFTFACIFLFLAVLPLIYAPETLSEKTMKDRELKNYLEKAQKVAQKEAEKNHKKDSAKAEEENKKRKKEPEEPHEDEEARKLAEKYY
jgi:MFS family permease